MSWFKVTLTGDMAKRHCYSLVHEILEYHLKIRLDDSVPFPTDAYVYKLIESPEGSCTYYFSPGASASYKELLDYYGGEHCFKPVPSEVAQSIGGIEATKFLND